MDLHIKGQLFLIGGATSGFGKATAEVLLAEGANVIAVARGEERLLHLKEIHPEQVEIINGDITLPTTLQQILNLIGDRALHGALINAGGPPAGSFMESQMDLWDEAYRTVLRWKVELTKALIPYFEKQQYGRLLYIESASVKQPIPNLVLSNSLRLAVVGFVKTLSAEIAHQGITLNILAPGYHATPAMNRLLKKKSEIEDITEEEAKAFFAADTEVRRMGEPEEFASLAAWLLSPMAGYLTGQTISVDGGRVKGIMG